MDVNKRAEQMVNFYQQTMLAMQLFPAVLYVS